MGYYRDIVVPFVQRFKRTEPLVPDPYNYAALVSGFVPYNLVAGATTYGNLPEVTAPGTYQNFSMTLIGTPNQYDGMINQPLGLPTTDSGNL